MARTTESDAKRVHMIGIGGVGMSGLADVMARMGYSVSGSDLRTAAVKDRLTSLGVRLFDGHAAGNLGDVDLVVASAAIPDDNPELASARERGIPVLTRAQMLGCLMSGTLGIAVSGTHGKTTTTSMVATVLERGKLDPTVLIGGDLDRLNGNARLGGSRLFLTEACEAYGSFLELYPTIAVVTNIEAEHLDYYGSLADVMNGFRQFLSQIQAGGCAILCVDCPNTRALASETVERVVTYGFSTDAFYRAVDLDEGTTSLSFNVVCEDCELGAVVLRVPGRHNVQNALAAVAVGLELGLGFDVISEALGGFGGATRRFDVLGTAGGITVVDDYAHHPTEVRATLLAARSKGQRIVAVFQPHMFSRTKQFAREFAKELGAADEVVVTEIYPAREKPVPGITAAEIVDLMTSDGSAIPVSFMQDKERIADALAPSLRKGDLVVFMGAGDIRTAAEMLLARLRADATDSSPEGIL